VIAVSALTVFRALHSGERVLLLPNVPRADLMFAVRAICRVARGTPVSVDLEGGYSDDPAEVADLVAELCAAGAVGINLEDGSGAPELLGAKITAIKRELQSRGGDIYVNARADVYLRDLASGDAALRETISRAKRYEEAGADGFFAPGLSDIGAIKSIASATKLPLNILASPGLPSVRELFALGVRRLSAGGRIAESAYGGARRIAAEFVRGDGNPDVLFSEPGMTYAEMNALFESS
jgi:2-methylisocitrate lyase-like PEP mutase family enzyme